jgi:hypothetical protein
MATTNPKYTPNDNRAFNQLTSINYDVCQYENSLNISSKPMKYYINDFNTPQVDPLYQFTVIGNQKQYAISNEFERPLPTRLNPIYPSYVLPYNTTPFLGAANPTMEYPDTESNLRFGLNLKEKKSSVGLSQIDYNRWDYVSPETVQNAGQFGNLQMGAQGPVRDSGSYYDYKDQNNVLFANSAWPNGGISTRNELHNYMEINKC